MATFGKQVSAGGNAAARPTFGKKVTSPPAGRFTSAPKEKMSPEALAFLNSERSRAPEVPAAKSGFQHKSSGAHSASLPGYASPAGLHAGKPVWARRIVAVLIDGLVFAVPLIMIIGAMGPQPNMTDAQFASGYVGVLLFLVLGSLAYAVGMESSSLQATLGKMAVGAIVTDKNGGKPTLGAVIMRNTLGKFVSGLTPLYISYLIGLARTDRRCLHDLIAGTMVCAKGKPSMSYEQTFA